MAVINATLTHFPHLSRGGLDDSYVSIDAGVDEKELGVSWDVVRTLQKFFYPGRVVRTTTDVYCVKSMLISVAFNVHVCTMSICICAHVI